MSDEPPRGLAPASSLSDAPARGAPLRAALWMAGAILSFTALALAGREVGRSLGPFDIMLWRSLVGLVLVAGALLLAGRAADMRPRRLRDHSLRNLVHFAGQNLWLYALTALPLAQVIALEFTSPLWVLLLAPLLLGERLSRQGLLAAALGFAGVLLVARPGAAGLSPGLLAAAGCAVCFALTNIATKRLTRTVPVGAILLWLNAMQLALALLATAAGGGVARPGPALWPLLLVVGVTGLTAHWCLTSALRAAPATVVMPLDFARLPVAAALGWLLYGEAPGPAALLGAALILGANALTLRRESRDPLVP